MWQGAENAAVPSEARRGCGKDFAISGYFCRWGGKILLAINHKAPIFIGMRVIGTALASTLSKAQRAAGGSFTL
jgi:hypothetical protein